MRRGKYSKKIKDLIVSLILNNKELVVKVATNLDINPKNYITWLQLIKKSIK